MSNDVRTCRASRATYRATKTMGGHKSTSATAGEHAAPHPALARRARCGVRNCATRHKSLNGIVINVELSECA